MKTGGTAGRLRCLVHFANGAHQPDRTDGHIRNNAFTPGARGSESKAKRLTQKSFLSHWRRMWHNVNLWNFLPFQKREEISSNTDDCFKTVIGLTIHMYHQDGSDANPDLIEGSEIQNLTKHKTEQREFWNQNLINKRQGKAVVVQMKV